jgi:hypothetical protein
MLFQINKSPGYLKFHSFEHFIRRILNGKQNYKSKLQNFDNY